VKIFSQKSLPQTTRQSTYLRWLFFVLTLFVLGGLVALFILKSVRKDTHLPQEIQKIRQLASTGDKNLADLLEHSMVSIPAGEFPMGSDTGKYDEAPQRLVYLDTFEIDRFEVTNIQYYQFVVENGHKPPDYWRSVHYPYQQADYPVVGVRWSDADAYCRWAEKRLPTEAEWEKACRGTDGRMYPWGDAWHPEWINVDLSAQENPPSIEMGDKAAWEWQWQQLQVIPDAPHDIGIRPIGSYPQGASPYGLMDMGGNVSEWVFDWYNWVDYSAMPDHKPVNLSPHWDHSLRGSAWHDPLKTASAVQWASRCSARNSSHFTADPRTGFRCAR